MDYYFQVPECKKLCLCFKYISRQVSARSKRYLEH